MLRLTLSALVLLAAGCAGSNAPGNAAGGFDPDAVDFDALQSLDYEAYVQPLLAARNAFAPAETMAPGDPDDYAWANVFGSAWGESIVPFDAERSLFVRFVEDLSDAIEIPYPNLRSLQGDELRFLKRWIEDGARGPDGTVPYADAEHLMYAAVQGENHIAVIDAARQQVIRIIPFDDHNLPSAPYGPHHIVFAPDRSAVYVSLISSGTVAKISGDLARDPSDPAYLLGHSPEGDFTTPGMMALSPDGSRLYVGRSTLSSQGTYGIGVFDPATMEQVNEFDLPDTDIPHALGLTPDGRYLLTAPLIGDRAIVIETASGNIVAQSEVGGTGRELVHFSVLPSEGPTYTATLTANNPRSEVLFFSLGADGALTLDGSVPTGPRAWHGHLDTDGRTVMVPNRAGDSVTRIDVPTREVVTIENPYKGGPIAMPHSPAPQHNGVFFVSSSNLQGTWTPPYPFLGPQRGEFRPELPNEAFGNVVAIDAATGEIVKTILLGAYPSGLEHYHGGGHGMHGEMDHRGMDHGEMDHDGMNHDEDDG